MAGTVIATRTIARLGSGRPLLIGGLTGAAGIALLAAGAVAAGLTYGKRVRAAQTPAGEVSARKSGEGVDPVVPRSTKG
ncbi:hypothetical protein [Streptomyces sp. NPDC057690]|uniref:hypothetical protein n=1 Tax=Streptomyces sp. NPDC057690 TaxID=3346214 RepID=UPI0036C56D76